MQNLSGNVPQGDQSSQKHSSLSYDQNSHQALSFNSATILKSPDDEPAFSEHSFSDQNDEEKQKDVSTLKHLQEIEYQNQLLTLLQYWRGHKERYVFQKDLVNVLVIYTGGTIGMEPSSSGLKARRDIIGDVFRKHVLLYDKKYVEEHFGVGSDEIVTPLTNFKHRIRVKVHQISRIEDSSNVDASTWTEICSVIDKEYANYESFLILHGTDTLAYSASALSFALEGLSRTVILTGAMLPLKDMRSDGYNNLIRALLISGHYFIPEVMIYFNDKLLRGNRTTKISSSEYEAFDSLNFKPLGEFKNAFKINWKYVLKPPGQNAFKVFVHLRAKISSIKITPLIHQKVFKAAFDPSFDAVVIQGYAMGNFPTRRVELLEIVKSAIQRDVIVVVASQVSKGAVIDSYEVLQQLTKLGALISLDMTFECVLCKLSYLLGKYSGNSKKVKELFLKNLRGELTEKFSIRERISLTNGKFVQAVATVVNNELPEDFKTLNKAFNPYFVNAVAGMGDDTAMYALKIQNFQFDETDFQGRTALHSAARWGKKENIKFLIKQDLDLNYTSGRVNLSPLAVAVKWRNFDCALYIYKKGGQFIMPKRQYSDMLCELGKEGDLELLRILHQIDCNLNISNFDGRTVGHVAASFDQIQLLRYLAKETDFNFKLQDRRKQSPLDALSEDLREEIVDVIKSR